MARPPIAYNKVNAYVVIKTKPEDLFLDSGKDDTVEQIESGALQFNTKQQYFLPVSGFNLNFSLVTGEEPLPTATFDLAIGETTNSRYNSQLKDLGLNPKTHGESFNPRFANINEILQSATTARSLIYGVVDLRGAKPRASSGRGANKTTFWPGDDSPEKGRRVVWVGKFAGLSRNRNQRSSAYTLHSTHWLNHISDGSLISSGFVSGNMANLFAKLTEQTNGLGTSRIDVAKLSAIARKQCGVYDITEDDGPGKPYPDLYNNIIVPIITSLALPENLRAGNNDGKARKTNTFRNTVEKIKKLKGCGVTELGEEYLNNLEENGFGNVETIRILTGLNPSDIDLSKDIPSKKSGVYYFINNEKEMRVPDLAIPSVDFSWQIIAGLCDVAASIASESIGSYSPLDKLLTMLSNFQITLIPGVKTGVIAAISPIFKFKDVWRQITADQILDVQVSGTDATADISGLGLVSNNMKFQTGRFSGPYLESQGNTTLQGLYLDQAHGQIYLENSPDFLSRHPFAAYISAQENTEADENQLKYITDANYYLPEPTEEQQAGIDRAACLYTKHRYSIIKHSQSSISVVLPFRLDIAPGSAVAFEMPSDNLQVSEFSSLEKLRFAMGLVTSVNVSLSALNKTATTTLNLSYVRKYISEEHEKGLPGKHPIYGKDEYSAYKGNPLVKIDKYDLMQDGVAE